MIKIAAKVVKILQIDTVKCLNTGVPLGNF